MSMTDVYKQTKLTNEDIMNEIIWLSQDFFLPQVLVHTYPVEMSSSYIFL